MVRAVLEQTGKKMVESSLLKVFRTCMAICEGYCGLPELLVTSMYLLALQFYDFMSSQSLTYDVPQTSRLPLILFNIYMN